MKILFTNGCSWTYGGGLDNLYDDETLRNEITWPAQLKTLMNFDRHVNLAEGCGSNQRIIRTTLEWIWQQTPKTLQNTTAVIQWTEPSRYEYYYPKDMNNSFESLPDRWARVKVGTVISKTELKDRSSYEEMFIDSQKRYENYTDIEGLYQHITHCESLASIFKSYGIKYYYWSYCATHGNMPPPYKRFFMDRYNWLESSGRHDWKYERISEKDHHPSTLGHKQLAEYIKETIEKWN